MSGPLEAAGAGTASAAADEPAVLLLVEDSPEDAEATRRAFVRAGIADARIIHCSTVEEVIDFLERRGPHTGRAGLQLPRLMILGLHTPRLDGKDMLRRLRASEHWCAVPVVVLTSSTRAVDVESCYRLGANGYLVRPQSREALVELAAKTKRYWFDTALTPRIRR